MNNPSPGYNNLRSTSRPRVNPQIVSLDTAMSRAIGLLLRNSAGWVRSYRSVKVARDLISAWEQEADKLEEGVERETHDQLIRLAKGQVKAWRIWLASRQR